MKKINHYVNHFKDKNVLTTTETIYLTTKYIRIFKIFIINVHTLFYTNEFFF